MVKAARGNFGVVSICALLALAACGGDNEPMATNEQMTTTSNTMEAKLPPEHAIKRNGDEWASLFGKADTAACELMTPADQPGCETIFAPPASDFQKSFAGATVKDVEVEGSKAGARFSNGETVEFSEQGDEWLVFNLGGSAGKAFFD